MATAIDPLLDSLVSDFGGNYVFALDLLEQYRRDPRSVEKSWRDYFDRLSGLPAEAEEAPQTPSPAPSPAETPQTGEITVVPAAAPPAARSRALVVPAILPGDIAQPIRGGAVR